MPIQGGFVGMVDRAGFDEWLRQRPEAAGARRRRGTFDRIDREPDGTVTVAYHGQDTAGSVRACIVIGADGARSAVALQCVPGAARMPYVFAFHEIVRSPAPSRKLPQRGATCITAPPTPPTSMAGCFRMAPPPASGSTARRRGPGNGAP